MGGRRKEKAAARGGLGDGARKGIGNGGFAGLERSVGKLNEAFKMDTGNILSSAYAAQTTGLEALLYGTDAARVDASIRDVVHIIHVFCDMLVDDRICIQRFG